MRDANPVCAFSVDRPRVFGARCSVLGVDPGIRYQVPGTRYLKAGTWDRVVLKR